MDPPQASASAIALKDGRVMRVGRDEDIVPLADSLTLLIDAGGRRVIPGLTDSHMHVIRGGLNYNMELRWDGVRSLGAALEMLRAQARATPPPQWVRVVGGWSETQFAEKRLPTLQEINAAAPDTPPSRPLTGAASGEPWGAAALSERRPAPKDLVRPLS